jgi:hypothetical protein
MTDSSGPNPEVSAAKEPASIGRAKRYRRAKRQMTVVTIFCVVIALVPPIDRLVTAGYSAFIDRPPGVGATKP